jgi:hypothetical protein
LTITGSTIKGDDAGLGGGILTFGGSTVLSHTIVAGNTGASMPSDVAGSMAVSFSLLGVDTDAIITNNGGNLIGTAGSPINPLLGPLADNGGPTLTHALLFGSPAIDAGDPAIVFNPAAFDQRGAPFSRVSSGRIDIGAFELQPMPPAFFGDHNQNGEVDAADYVVWRKALGSNVTPYSGADGNGDGVVDQADRGVWGAHFGQTVPVSAAASGAAAVVESEAADPHPLDNSRPLPKGEVIIVATAESSADASQRPALPGVSVAELLTVAGARAKPPAEPGAVGSVAISERIVRRQLRSESAPVASRRDNAQVACWHRNPTRNSRWKNLLQLARGRLRAGAEWTTSSRAPSTKYSRCWPAARPRRPTTTAVVRSRTTYRSRFALRSRRTSGTGYSCR